MVGLNRLPAENASYPKLAFRSRGQILCATERSKVFLPGARFGSGTWASSSAVLSLSLFLPLSPSLSLCLPFAHALTQKCREALRGAGEAVVRSYSRGHVALGVYDFCNLCLGPLGFRCLGDSESTGSGDPA